MMSALRIEYPGMSQAYQVWYRRQSDSAPNFSAREKEVASKNTHFLASTERKWSAALRNVFGDRRLVLLYSDPSRRDLVIPGCSIFSQSSAQLRRKGCETVLEYGGWLRTVGMKPTGFFHSGGASFARRLHCARRSIVSGDIG